MGSKSKQPKDTVLNANVDSAINQVKTPTPLETAQNAYTKDIFDWRDGAGAYAGAPRDITKLKGIGDVVDIYGMAQANAAKQRFGNPGMALANTANTAYSNQINAQNQMDMAGQTASAVDDARRQILGGADLMAGNLIGYDANRNMNVAQLQMANRAGIWNKPKKRGLLSTLFLTGKENLERSFGGGGTGA